MPLCGWTRGRNWGCVCRILSLSSGVSETVRALVLRARCWKFGPGSPAATALVTGDVLIPFRRVLQPPPLPRPLPLVSYSILEVAMAPRKRKKSAPADALPPQLATVNLHAAGVDVGAEEHWAAVPACDDAHPVRRFGANTADLDAWADWFWDCGITTVALASTGVSWIPLFEVREARGFQVRRVDPGTMPRNGRPTSDVHECQWLQRLHTSGVLSACVHLEYQGVVLPSSG